MPTNQQTTAKKLQLQKYRVIENSNYQSHFSVIKVNIGLASLNKFLICISQTRPSWSDMAIALRGAFFVPSRHGYGMF